MAGEHYTQQYAGGFKDSPDTTTPVVAAFLNKLETTLLFLLGADPTDKAAQVWDAALGRFKTALIKDENIDPAAAIAGSKLTNIPASKLASFPNDPSYFLRGDGSWKQRLMSTRAAVVSTAGTTFATGADLLAAPITFTADGTHGYLITVSCDAWVNSGVNVTLIRVNLDGNDAGLWATWNCPAANFSAPLFGLAFLATPSAGVHTLNARLTTGAGTASVNGAAGGAGTHMPIVVTMEQV